MHLPCVAIVIRVTKGANILYDSGGRCSAAVGRIFIACTFFQIFYVHPVAFICHTSILFYLQV